MLKVGNPADAAGTVEMQVLAMEHALTADPGLPIARPRRTVDGRPTGSVAIDGVEHAVQLVAFIDGNALPPGPASPTTRRSIGAAVARLDQALAGFSHPLAHRALLWDVARLPRAPPQARLPRARTPRARRALPSTATRPPSSLRSRSSRSSTIHGDVNPGNVLVCRDDPERVAGIVDFGDLVHTRTVIDPAIAAAYQAFGSADPLDPLVEVVTAYHAIRPLTAAELRLVPELAAARMAQSLLISAWRAELHPDNVDYILADAEDCFATLALLDEHDPAALGGLAGRGVRRPVAAARQPRREPVAAGRPARAGALVELRRARPPRVRVTASGSPMSTATGCSTRTTTCRRWATPTRA